MNGEKKIPPILYWFILVCVLLTAFLVGTWYFWDLSEKQATTILTHEASITEQSNQLSSANTRIVELEGTLLQVREDLEDLEDDYRDEKNRNEEFEDQIRKITDTYSMVKTHSSSTEMRSRILNECLIEQNELDTT